MDVKKNVDHWAKGAQHSVRLVPYLLDGNYYAEAVFNAHLAAEKILKAHVVSSTETQPPRTHNLARLAELAEIDLTEAQRQLCADLYSLQAASRYLSPDDSDVEEEEAIRLARETEELVKCLMKKL